MKIPLLIIIAYFIIKKKSKSNVKIKLMALSFSLILFMAVNYIVQQASLKQVYNFRKQAAMAGQLQGVRCLLECTLQQRKGIF